MLMVSSYGKGYVAACRARLGDELAAYRELVSAARAGGASDAAIDAFESRYCVTVVLALDHAFAHRGRGMEGKDGNPLNEVRLLCTSLLEGDGVLVADKAIRLTPESSILGLQAGDAIALREADVVRLADAFLAEIERRYP